MIPIQLDGKTAIITGGASGIGRAGVARFRAAGANVVLVDVDESAAKTVAADLDPAAASVVPMAADVTDEDALATVFARAHDQFGQIDCIWNNAGVESIGPIAMVTTEEYRRLFDVNVLGVLLGTKLAMMHLADGGTIINTASVAGLSGIPLQVLYAGSKAAVVSISKTAALEGAGRQIRCNCICPAIVDTPMIAKTFGAEPPPELKARMGATTPLGRLIEPEEVADLAAFLASDLASFVTGQALAIDGAMTAGPQLDVGAMLGS